MAISFVGAATGVNTATMPAHQVGDLIVVFAFRDGSTTAVTPQSGYTVQKVAGANSCTGTIATKLAASSSETVGTWTDATSVVVAVYRGVDQSTPVSTAGISTSTAASTTVTYAALQFSYRSDGTSWVIGVAGHRSTNTTLETPPAGMVLRANTTDATDEAALFDTDGGVTGWPSKNVSVGGTSSGWRSFTMEILAAIEQRRRVLLV